MAQGLAENSPYAQREEKADDERPPTRVRLLFRQGCLSAGAGDQTRHRRSGTSGEVNPGFSAHEDLGRKIRGTLEAVQGALCCSEQPLN